MAVLWKISGRQVSFTNTLIVIVHSSPFIISEFLDGINLCEFLGWRKANYSYFTVVSVSESVILLIYYNDIILCLIVGGVNNLDLLPPTVINIFLPAGTLTESNIGFGTSIS